jgi:hypothetical protein
MENTILYTIATSLINDQCEAQLFNDGHVEIEDPACNFQALPTAPLICLSRDEAKELRNFLNSIDL